MNVYFPGLLKVHGGELLVYANPFSALDGRLSKTNYAFSFTTDVVRRGFYVAKRVPYPFGVNKKQGKFAEVPAIQSCRDSSLPMDFFML